MLVWCPPMWRIALRIGPYGVYDQIGGKPNPLQVSGDLR